ncbi:iron-sulfur cluster repair protein YtfE (RIC family) [Pseudarthrobacter defluvii]|uniref:Iron-sulfur cluster repair protein YtfE (RIC family) n=1 Tax=Pseudarthrobacter defluvii TaxID=410837 RepID=A0ABT9UEJ6_9MICC|nr:hemerythrin domain-containing protein [Pseudarthrobacter defluvii]MDQ0118054.1 iron-sulfur cluster repair protein YtfE (RIC family) [Pseudarthrobacter defluvii]
MDIVEVILNDHHEQRRLFALLDEMHASETSSLEAVWKRMRILLEVHAKAEEELFYPELLELGKGAGGKDSAADETTDAIHDHNEIRDAISDVDRQQTGTADWWEALAKLNEANGDHMAEEEREGLTDFRQHASLELRHRLGLAFSIFESEHAGGIEPEDVSPEEYVREHE